MKNKSLFTILIILLFVGCHTTEEKFEKMVATKDISGLNKFISECSDTIVYQKAIYKRDSLISLDFKNTFSYKAFLNLRKKYEFKESQSILNQLVSNIENCAVLVDSINYHLEIIKKIRTDINPFSIVDNTSLKKTEQGFIYISIFELYISLGIQYFEIAQMSDSLGIIKYPSLKLSAWFFYKASESMIISATKLNLVELNLSDIDFILKDKYVDSENTITGGILYSYLKSAAIFRLAGFKEHANWMLSGKGLKNFTFKDVPDIPDIDFGNIK